MMGRRRRAAAWAAGLSLAGVFIVTIWLPTYLQPIRIYDEAIYVNNALELARNGDALVLHNNCAPSTHNVKPPLAVWLQAAAVLALGPAEWALRLPTVAGVALACGMIVWFCRRWLSGLTAWVAGLVFLCSEGVATGHVGHTADLDGVLLGLTAAYSLLFADYVLRGRRRARRLALMTALVTCAFYAKSVAAFLPLPGLLLGALLVGRGSLLLADWRPYALGVGGLCLCGLYYVAREAAGPGYWDIVYASEYARYTETVMPWHAHPWWYYLGNLRTHFFRPYWVLALATPVVYAFADSQTRRALLVLVAAAGGYLAVVSYPTVKLSYYDAPAYPTLAILAAAALVALGRGIARAAALRLPRSSPALGAAVAVALALTAAWGPVRRIIGAAYRTEAALPLEREGVALRRLAQDPSAPSHLKVVMKASHPSHLDQALFYVKRANVYDRRHFALVTSPAGIAPGDTLLCAQPETLAEVGTAFRLEPLGPSRGGASLYVVTEPTGDLPVAYDATAVLPPRGCGLR